MTYDTSVPQAAQSLGETQAPIQTNFSIIDTRNSVNHVAFNDAGGGKHKFLQLPEQGAAPATAADEGGLYTKAQNAVTELFFRRESNGAEIQLTAGGAGAGAPIRAVANFVWTGAAFTLRYGSNVVLGGLARTSAGLYTVTFQTALPSANYIVQLSAMPPSAGGGDVRMTSTIRGSATYSDSVSATRVILNFVTHGGAGIDPTAVFLTVLGG